MRGDQKTMTTIYGKSNHPVFVKKINLNAWTLRDEIEALLAEKVKELGKSGPDDLTHEEVEQIKNFYLAREAAPNNVLQFVKNEEKSSGEPAPELAEALEAAATPEGLLENLPEATTPDAGGALGDVKEDDMKAAMEELAGATEAKIPPAAPTSEIPNFTKDSTPFRRKPKLLAEEKASPGVLILSDINMDEILFFAKDEFAFGQSIVIEFLVPNYFIVSAEVVSCLRYNRRSRIINPSRPEYRLKARFTFQTMGERTLLRNFLKSISPDVPKPAKKVASKTEAKDDLSDLGL